MECNSKMFMDNRHATLDPGSPNNVYSSITDLSEFPSRSCASPYHYGSAYSCASSSFYQGDKNRCPKTEMSENRRVPSMTDGSTSNSGPDLSGYATDDGPVITERKNTLFGDATGDGSILPERRKPKTFFGQAADLVKKMGGVGISAHDASKLAELERKMKTLFDEAAEIDRRTAAQAARKHNHLYVREIEKSEKQKEIIRGGPTEDGSLEAEINRKTLLADVIDAADDGFMTAEIEWRKESLVGDTADDGFMTAETEWSNKSFLGNASDDESLTTEIERKNEILFADAANDGSMQANIDCKNNLFADAADDLSIIAERRTNTSFADAIDDESIIAVSGKKKKWFADAIDDGPKIAERRTKKKEEGRTKWLKFLSILFLLLVEFILPRCLSGLFEPSLIADTLRNISEESMARRRLSDRLDFVARKLSRIVPGQVVNCTASESAWKLQQDGMLVYSHCTLYSSMAEEVSLRGFPSQTVGVMGRGITDRSFTIMSGRMIEWLEGKTDYAVHQEGDSWTHERLTASVVQMDEKTWILEYRHSVIFQGGGLVSWALRFLKWRICGICERGRSNFRSFLLPKVNIRHIYGDLRTPT